MSYSNEERLHNLGIALLLMLEGLDSKPITDVEFEPAEAPFSDSVFATTWKDLEYRGYVHRRQTVGKVAYILTGDGWLAAIAYSDEGNHSFRSDVDQNGASFRWAVIW